MRKLWNLTKRDCLVFLKDHSAVFFSLLSMLIVLMLMVVFLGNMNVDEITELLQQYGGARDTAADQENALHLVQYWTLAGILVVNAVTVTLTVIGVMVNDTHEQRLESFYVAPVSRGLIACAYILSAAIIGFLFCMLTLGVALAYICATGGAMLSTEAVLKIMAYTFVNVLIFSIMMYLVALFIKSSSAWSGIATIVGTLIGFVGAIYLPMGFLPSGVAIVLKYIPILHGASLMRKVCCADLLNTTFAGLDGAVSEGYQEYMGISIVMQDKTVTDIFQILFLLICGMIALVAVLLIARKKNISDR